MTTTATNLTAALQERDIRAEVLPTVPHQPDGIQVWKRGQRSDRYSHATIWEPGEDNPSWIWGDDNMFSAPPDIGTAELAEKVIATMDRWR